MKTESLYISKKNVQQRTLRQMVLESKVVLAMAELFSAILGEKVSAIKAIKLANAQAAIASMIVFGGISPLVAAIMLTWVGASVYQCKDKQD
mgnify:FL=1